METGLKETNWVFIIFVFCLLLLLNNFFVSKRFITLCYKEPQGRSPRRPRGIFRGDHEQKLLLKAFLVVTNLLEQYSKLGATGLKLWKGATNHKRLRATVLKFLSKSFYFISSLINFNLCCELDRFFLRIRALFYAVKIKSLIKPIYTVT